MNPFLELLKLGFRAQKDMFDRWNRFKRCSARLWTAADNKRFVARQWRLKELKEQIRGWALKFPVPSLLADVEATVSKADRAINAMENFRPDGDPTDAGRNGAHESILNRYRNGYSDTTLALDVVASYFEGSKMPAPGSTGSGMPNHRKSKPKKPQPPKELKVPFQAWQVFRDASKANGGKPTIDEWVAANPKMEIKISEFKRHWESYSRQLRSYRQRLRDFEATR